LYLDTVFPLFSLFISYSNWLRIWRIWGL